MIQSLRERLRNSSYFRDIVWQASGNSLAQIVGVLGIPLLTRLYSPHDFALQNLFLQAVGLLTGIMTWRYEYFIQLPKEERDSDNLLKLVVLLGLGMLVIFMPIFWIFRETLANWSGDLALAPWLIFAPISALLICYALGLQHKVQRYQDFRRSGLSELTGKSTYIGAGICLSGLTTNALGLIAAPAFSAIGKIFYLFLSVKAPRLPAPGRGPKSKFKLDFHELLQLAKSYLRLSNSMVYSHLMMTLTAAIPAIYIAREYGGNTLGQFTLVVSTLYLPAGLIGAAIGQVYYQRAAEHWANKKDFEALWQTTSKRLIYIGVPVYAFAALISPWAYPFVFGQAWQDAGNFASLMAIAAFFSFISSPLDRTSLVVGVWWYLPAWHTFRTISTIGVAMLASLNNWDFEYFLRLLVAQMSLIYLIDFISERHFSLRE